MHAVLVIVHAVVVNSVVVMVHAMENILILCPVVVS